MNYSSTSTASRARGYTDFSWLKAQSLDDHTSRLIDQIEKDENNFIEKGIITEGNDEIALRMRQGVFHTTRRTSHTLASIFVQIFKCREHMQAEGFCGQDGDIVVDIGANEGYYALKIAQNKSIKVIAVEPNPVAYELLCRNIDSNHAKNIKTLNSAIWSRKGVSNFNTIPQVTSVGTLNISETSFLAKVKNRVVQIPVETLTLRDLMKEFKIDKIDILKIDVEGGELEILESSQESLRLTKKIVMEYHSQNIRRDAIKLLESLGFRLIMHTPDRADFGDLYFEK